jgi:hypothetical protein
MYHTTPGAPRTNDRSLVRFVLDLVLLWLFVGTIQCAQDSDRSLSPLTPVALSIFFTASVIPPPVYTYVAAPPSEQIVLGHVSLTRAYYSPDVIYSLGIFFNLVAE